MRTPRGLLTYCSNVDFGDSWAETRRTIEGPIADVRRRVAPSGRLGIGVRLSARTLRELKSPRVDLFKALAASANAELQREAVAALAAAKSEVAVPALLEVWPSLNSTLRRMAVDRLASSAAGSRQLVAAVGSGAISRD